MKKKFLFLVILLLLLSACSSSESGTGDGLLVKEIHSKTVNYDGTQTTTSYKYTYNGNKIATLVYGSYILTFRRYTYTGDLITKVTDGDGGGGYVWMEYQYEYDGQNRLVKETTLSYSNLPDDIKIYTYNADGTVIRESYHGNAVNPAELYETIKFYVDSFNRLVKLETFDGTNWTVKNQITYTNHNSPFLNVTGYDKLYLISDTKNGFNTFTNYTNASTYQYSVNGAGFPVQRVEKYKSANGGVFSTTTEKYKY
jgi:hypothetical protein